jgi:hypothetical protein
VLPPFTVALTFMVIILAGLVAPFILNAKYMRVWKKYLDKKNEKH